VLPERPNAVRLVLRHGDAVLAERTRSASTPVVTLTAPAGGEVWDAGAQTVAWQASDADGDNVAVSVQYSRDRGQSWRTLDTVAASQMLEVDGAALPGSARLGAMMRLLATDGFNGAIATSEPFTVADKAPRARILSPESGQSVGKNAYLELSGHSVDPEDGALSGEALSWRSDRDGALGKGLTVSPRLSPGGHWITFSARDSDGNVATDLLRLIVKDAPSHQPVADAGADQEVYAGDAVQVDGSNSFDTDGDALGYDWRVVSAPAVVSLDLADPARPEFEAAAAGVYAFELRVSDGTVGSYPDRVTVTVR
jgi:hypothetical protein